MPLLGRFGVNCSCASITRFLRDIWQVTQHLQVAAVVMKCQLFQCYPGNRLSRGIRARSAQAPRALLHQGSTWVWYLLSTGLERQVSNSILQLSGSFQLSLPTSPSSLCKNGDDTTPAPQWEAAKMSAFTCRELSDTGVIITMKQSTEK